MDSLKFRQALPLVVLSALLSLTGCGDSSMGDVQGVITLDGQPLPDAFIRFVPTGEGASSFGKSSSDGTYRMKFTDTKYGVSVGEHQVSISTGDVKSDNSGVVPEVVPKLYNSETTLTSEVVPGRNTVDFDLKSDQE